MSDDAEKPFEATPQRIAKARREGNVARAGELSANCAFAAALAGCIGIAPAFAAAARGAIAASAAGRASFASAGLLIACAGVPIAAAAAAGTLAAALQTGLRFVAPVPKAERLNPGEGFKRIASRETAIGIARAALAFAMAGASMVPIVVAAIAGIVRAGTIEAVAAVAWQAGVRAGFVACATGALFALAEYATARNAWLRKLRMSFDERKREAKEEEGDPLARGRRRALHRSLLRGALREVPKAAFIVANPTHVAVAIEYRPPAVAVPRVLVRAAGEAALRVRALAQQHRIPVIENVALARALFADSRAGAPISEVHYVAVAEIVAALARDLKEGA